MTPPASPSSSAGQDECPVVIDPMVRDLDDAKKLLRSADGR